MNKKLRDGVDIQVAFSSRIKCLSSGLLEKNSTNTAPSKTSIKTKIKGYLRKVARYTYNRAKPLMSISVKLKGYLRRIAQYAYGLLKPLLRPIAFRVRQYLIEGLHTELRHLNDRLTRIEQYSYTTTRRVAINCGSEEILVKTSVGFILCAANDYAVLTCLVETGDLERGTRLLIEKLLKPGDVFVDVGANIGMHTLAAARAIQGRGKIIAFEPFEPTARILEKSVEMNGFSHIVEIHQAAVSNISGHHNLYLGTRSGHHSLFPLDETPHQAPVDVPLVRLDDIIPTTQKVNLLKIDAEGAELEVIESATSLISNNPNISLIVEFGPTHLQRTGHTPEEWFHTFFKLGLDFRVIHPDTGFLEKWTIKKLLHVESANLLFSHNFSISKEQA